MNTVEFGLRRLLRNILSLVIRIVQYHVRCDIYIFLSNKQTTPRALFPFVYAHRHTAIIIVFRRKYFVKSVGYRLRELKRDAAGVAKTLGLFISDTAL